MTHVGRFLTLEEQNARTDDFSEDREFWLSRPWNTVTSIDYVIFKTKQTMEIL